MANIFDPRSDTPFLLDKEALTTNIRFDRNGPTTGLVSWNIPVPFVGCTAETQAYCGMLVTLNTIAANPTNAPVNGTIYTADPTGDTNLHAGDKLNGAMVIGAFYQDRVTTSLAVTGLQPNVAYYVSGYPIDCQNRFYKTGIYAYSLDFILTTGTDIQGYHNVKMGQNGILGTDATLLNTTTTYSFTMNVDGKIDFRAVNFSNTPIAVITGGTNYTITVLGSDALTYDDLVAELNKKISLVQNPALSPTPPNTNAYYWNNTTQKLFLWDGFQHVELPVIIEDSAPNVPMVGGYWYNTSNKILYKWDGASWLIQNIISYSQDPKNLNCDDYWFNGTTVYLWNGTTWIAQTIHNQLTDPALPSLPPCGSYWFNDTTDVLYGWKEATQTWQQTQAITWDIDPNALVAGTYWFNTTNSTLYQLDTPVLGWNAILATNVRISETPPASPAPGIYWYNPATEELKQRNIANTAWNDLDVLVWAEDPEPRSSGDLWWNTITDQLNVWDITTSSWDLVTSFFITGTDPAAAPVLTTSDVWYNPTTMQLYKWDGMCWVLVQFINYPTDPTLPAVNDVWFNTVTNAWSVWNGVAWVVINPINSATDPYIPALGSYWFNVTLNALNQWNGSSWVTLLYSAVPLTPTTGLLWFDLLNDVLKEWDGNTWIISIPLVVVTINSDGDLVFTRSKGGSFYTVCNTNIDLFTSLSPGGVLHKCIPGQDAVSPEPSYMEVGIGTDGTPDQRLDMIQDVRHMLGHPTIQIELTNSQLDFCIQNAIEQLRTKSSVPYKRGFFFLQTEPGEQIYHLTNKASNTNKIVTIMGAYRTSSAFLSTAYGSGVFGQVVLQHLYTMGTFDLLSYHLVSQYVEQLEHLFAARLTYTWDEYSRTLQFMRTFAGTELILIDATVERTEQEILTNRWAKNWLQLYTAAQGRLILSEIRGKFSSLPGAGGGISLNASDLRTQALADLEKLQAELDDYIVNDVENYGSDTQFIIG